MTKPFYELVTSKDSSELMEKLSPTSDRFQWGQWIFRGQSVDRPLLPTAYREENLTPMKSRPWEEWTYLYQARAELKLIRRFYGIADYVGLPIPEDSYDVRQELDTIDRDRDEFVRLWPTGRLLPLIALAQHHGIATRLLDWTRSPWVAAYFAAEEVLRRGAITADSSIVIWAFDSTMSTAAADDPDNDGATPPIEAGFVEVVTTPYGNNRNLAAQKGVHLLYRTTDVQSAMAIVRRDPFDTALQRNHAAAVKDYERALYKFVLPASEAGGLLRLIAKHGVTGASLFPGFDGVARTIKDQNRIARG